MSFDFASFRSFASALVQSEIPQLFLLGLAVVIFCLALWVRYLFTKER